MINNNKHQKRLRRDENDCIVALLHSLLTGQQQLLAADEMKSKYLDDRKNAVASSKAGKRNAKKDRLIALERAFPYVH